MTTKEKTQTKKTKQIGKFDRNRIFTINDPNAPRLVPALAKEIGLNESILLLQIEYWIAISDNVREGCKWTYQSTSDIQKTFSFWSESTIKRTVKSLKDKGLILTGNFNKLSFDKTNWFTINMEEVAKLNSISIKAYEESENNLQQSIREDAENLETNELEYSEPINSLDSEELRLIEEKVWEKVKAMNPTTPVDKLQKDAVRQLANHIKDGTTSFNDLVCTGIMTSNFSTVIPTTILRNIGKYKYEIYGSPVITTEWDDLYEDD